MKIKLSEFKKQFIKAWPKDPVRKGIVEDFLELTFQQYAGLYEVCPSELIFKQMENLGVTINRLPNTIDIGRKIIAEEKKQREKDLKSHYTFKEFKAGDFVLLGKLLADERVIKMIKHFTPIDLGNGPIIGVNVLHSNLYIAFEELECSPVCNFSSLTKGPIVRLVLDDPIEGERWYCEAKDAEVALEELKHNYSSDYDVEFERMEDAIKVMKWWENGGEGLIPVVV